MIQSKLDIIICTYEREALLIDCIKSLSVQDQSTENWNIIVVNNSNVKFAKSTVQCLEQLNNLSIINEADPGLSIARNSGVKASQSEWVGFLDDDATVPFDYISRALKIINEHSFDCFGGHIKSWWKYGQPRWLDDDYGSKPLLRQGQGVISEGYNWGSNIFIRRKALDDVGLFPIKVGMRGKQLGYAAENIVQKELRIKGYLVGYDPDLYINHVVMPQKLKISWHLKAAYATGRDGRDIFPEQYCFQGFFKSLKSCFSKPIKSLYKLISKSEYYWEHVVLESLEPISLLSGKLASLLRKKS